MRVALTSRSKYPARIEGIGSSRVHDLIAKGLGELGHRVYYRVAEGTREPPPEGVAFVADFPPDADVFHLHDYPVWGPPPPGRIWLRGIHAPRDSARAYLHRIDDRWIFVSASHARSFGKTRHVLNGIDPKEFSFSAAKEPYFLFMVWGAKRAEDKGLRAAVSLSDRMGFPLQVAGIRPEDAVAHGLTQAGRGRRTRFLGHVSGPLKADLLAGARALLFPTLLEETFGLVMAEALMSGTPVICSDRGACPELVTKDVGFVCASEEDYIRAIENVARIEPAVCRQRALQQFHYLRMARDYVAEYEKELAVPPAMRGFPEATSDTRS